MQDNVTMHGVKSLERDGNGEPSRVGVIDYGVGNVGSIRNMLRRVGVLADVVSHPDDLLKVARAVLPGIGHFEYGMSLLRQGGWVDPILSFARDDKRPLLGICLGMQLLARRSEEGDCEGLGLLDAEVRYFDLLKMRDPLPIPHMGWAQVKPASRSRLFAGMAHDAKFYFVHSFHMVAVEKNDYVAGTSAYGYDFVSAVERDNIYGVQFHPEKSHLFGMDFLSNFCRLPC